MHQIVLTSNNCNYNYNAMSFGLKNAWAIYQRLIDVVFFDQIGWTLEVTVIQVKPSLFKEVQPLIGWLAFLSIFILCAKDNAFHFFITLQKGKVWTNKQMLGDVHKVKTFFGNPHILTWSEEEGVSLYLYLLVVTGNSILYAIFFIKENSYYFML